MALCHPQPQLFMQLAGFNSSQRATKWHHTKIIQNLCKQLKRDHGPNEIPSISKHIFLQLHVLGSSTEIPWKSKPQWTEPTDCSVSCHLHSSDGIHRGILQMSLLVCPFPSKHSWYTKHKGEVSRGPALLRIPNSEGHLLQPIALSEAFFGCNLQVCQSVHLDIQVCILWMMSKKYESTSNWQVSNQTFQEYVTMYRSLLPFHAFPNPVLLNRFVEAQNTYRSGTSADALQGDSPTVKNGKDGPLLFQMNQHMIVLLAEIARLRWVGSRVA